MKRMIALAAALSIAAAAFAENLTIDPNKLKQIAEESSVIAAFEQNMQTDEQFQTVMRFILPDPGEAKWRQIPWTPDIWEGRIRAAQQEKPMFIWAMNGDPLGCV